ncbi:Gfo/Idh/MocA family protein [Legionella clemsonensis]|uniref:Oxidoreductase YteT n=1 Tax=Legionella clemsonensis TaxID=1867846 RepID=A0A222P4U0_9GAMM|nr:Gfo/Idh/MocA family oxidoreductase [Legionella clemsonensis]ASQ46859.1 Putative oxidoreductase YteT precursor [Legionella clemsonensis]
MISTIAVVGLGQMGTSYTRHASTIADKVICFDYDENQRATFKDRIQSFHNPFDGLNECNVNTETIRIVDDLDLVWKYDPDLTIITTHKDSHCFYSCLAMKNNSHVLTEKPLCMNLEEAKKIQAISSQLEKKVFIGFSLHATPAFIKLKEHLSVNKKGKIKLYQVYRIGAVPEDYMDSVSVRFDLLSHDTDFCLQLFKFPQHTRVNEVDARSCNKLWQYDGFEVEMIGRMPITHPNGFEYGYKLIYQDGNYLEFSSKQSNSLFMKNVRNNIIDIIPLEITSPCKMILEKSVNSIIKDSYECYLNHELSILKGVNCMAMLSHDHKSGIDD